MLQTLLLIVWLVVPRILLYYIMWLSPNNAGSFIQTSRGAFELGQQWIITGSYYDRHGETGRDGTHIFRVEEADWGCRGQERFKCYKLHVMMTQFKGSSGIMRPTHRRGQDRTGHPPKEMSTEVASLLEGLGRRVAIIIIIAINHKV